MKGEFKPMEGKHAQNSCMDRGRSWMESQKQELNSHKGVQQDME